MCLLTRFGTNSAEISPLRLGRLNAAVNVRAALAAAPTITPVGMAAITPGADERFDVELSSDARLVVHVDRQARPYGS